MNGEIRLFKILVSSPARTLLLSVRGAAVLVFCAHNVHKLCDDDGDPIGVFR